ncbi:hypothetical protein BD779DRAFT_1477410 [Infundibulicybe gibba]|nr:hypothetical protein BD779DRAFT_1477410 [Infundibulicybe gibba]
MTSIKIEEDPLEIGEATIARMELDAETDQHIIGSAMIPTANIYDDLGKLIQPSFEFMFGKYNDRVVVPDQVRKIQQGMTAAGCLTTYHLHAMKASVDAAEIDPTQLALTMTILLFGGRHRHTAQKAARELVDNSITSLKKERTKLQKAISRGKKVAVNTVLVEEVQVSLTKLYQQLQQLSYWKVVFYNETPMLTFRHRRHLSQNEVLHTFKETVEEGLGSVLTAVTHARAQNPDGPDYKNAVAALEKFCRGKGLTPLFTIAPVRAAIEDLAGGGSYFRHMKIFSGSWLKTELCGPKNGSSIHGGFLCALIRYGMRDLFSIFRDHRGIMEVDIDLVSATMQTLDETQSALADCYARGLDGMDVGPERDKLRSEVMAIRTRETSAIGSLAKWDDLFFQGEHVANYMDKELLSDLNLITAKAWGPKERWDIGSNNFWRLGSSGVYREKVLEAFMGQIKTVEGSGPQGRATVAVMKSRLAYYFATRRGPLLVESTILMYHTAWTQVDNGIKETLDDEDDKQIKCPPIGHTTAMTASEAVYNFFRRNLWTQIGPLAIALHELTMPDCPPIPAVEDFAALFVPLNNLSKGKKGASLDALLDLEAGSVTYDPSIVLAAWIDKTKFAPVVRQYLKAKADWAALGKGKPTQPICKMIIKCKWTLEKSSPTKSAHLRIGPALFEEWFTAQYRPKLFEQIEGARVRFGLLAALDHFVLESKQPKSRNIFDGHYVFIDHLIPNPTGHSRTLDPQATFRKCADIVEHRIWVKECTKLLKSMEQSPASTFDTLLAPEAAEAIIKFKEALEFAQHRKRLFSQTDTPVMSVDSNIRCIPWRFTLAVDSNQPLYGKRKYEGRDGGPQQIAKEGFQLAYAQPVAATVGSGNPIVPPSSPPVVIPMTAQHNSASFTLQNQVAEQTIASEPVHLTQVEHRLRVANNDSGEDADGDEDLKESDKDNEGAIRGNQDEDNGHDIDSRAANTRRAGSAASPDSRASDLQDPFRGNQDEGNGHDIESGAANTHRAGSAASPDSRASDLQDPLVPDPTNFWNSMNPTDLLNPESDVEDLSSGEDNSAKVKESKSSQPSRPGGSRKDRNAPVKAKTSFHKPQPSGVLVRKRGRLGQSPPGNKQPAKRSKAQLSDSEEEAVSTRNQGWSNQR